MILSDIDISKKIDAGQIKISPFDAANIGTNSYDVHLGDTLLVYDSYLLDAKKRNSTSSLVIPDEGIDLVPGTLYLGCTVEYTESLDCVPLLEGKSSVGRLGIRVHATAGFGDIGFKGHWTLEIDVIQPVRVHKGMPIAQLYWIQPVSQPVIPYNGKPFAKYVNQPGVPVASKMYLNFK